MLVKRHDQHEVEMGRHNGLPLPARLPLLKHDAAAAVLGRYFQLHRLPGRRDAALQWSKRLRDGGSTDARAERDNLLLFHALQASTCIFGRAPGRLQRSAGYRLAPMS